jgi:hypothetical protein
VDWNTIEKISSKPIGTKDWVVANPVKFYGMAYFIYFLENSTKKLNLMESFLCVTHSHQIPMFSYSPSKCSMLQDSRCSSIQFRHFFYFCVSRILHSKEILKGSES